MNNNAKKWVEALRKGNYQQGRGSLAALRYPEDTVYCCLGVACEIAIQNGAIVRKTIEEGFIHYGSQSGVLPWEVQEWLGLKTCNGSFGQESLVSFNDGGMNFEAIADVIEAEPEGLFITHLSEDNNDMLQEVTA